MSAKVIATATLPIYLLKPHYRDGAKAIRKSGLSVDSIAGVGDLYTDASVPRPPKWMSFFDGHIQLNQQLLNSNSAGVLFINRGQRIFAVTFGHGKFLLTQGCWDEGFGLRVTLNSIDPKKIKSMDHKTFEAVTRHSRTQTSREGSTEDFGLDVERDLVRAVTGEPRAPKLGKRLTGMDALVAVAKVDITGLPSLLDLYLTQYSSQAYKTEFPWIDNISEVRDPAQRMRLDSKLAARLQQQNLTRLWLSVPDIVDWGTIGGFKYLRSDTVLHPDLHAREFLRSVKDPASITPDFLRGRRILVMDPSGDNVLEEWPVYRCVYSEEDDGPDTFLLSTGKWYRIETNFVLEVNKAIQNLVSTRAPLPPYESTDANEEAYNKRVANDSNGAYALMDQRFIYHGGGKSKFELCDLYTDAHEMIAVKRYGGSSAPLSHLCQQALVVAQMWKGDPEFRKKANKELPRSHKLPDSTKTPDTTQFPIVFGIVSRSKQPIDRSLPFFSRLTLRNVARQLQLLGYPVSILKIEQV
ncbi:MAG: TIGR04141 family sporadically distributed protein [Polyangiaceae bacterium]|nr:TIGR04141 family sporadically distributed protein [Polyangiaceae bacterium]